MWASPVDAAEWKLCVEPPGETHKWQADCENGSFPSVAAAGNAVESLPGLLVGDLVTVRVAESGVATPLVESPLIDLSSAAGVDLSINYGERVACPDPSSPQWQPLIEIVGGGLTTVYYLVTDMGPDGPCPGSRPGVLARGGGGLALFGVSLAGWSEFAAHSDDGQTGHLGVALSSIRNGSGVALRSVGDLSCSKSEIVGNHLPSDFMAPALVWAGTQGTQLTLEDSVLFGNLVDGSLAGRSLVHGTACSIRRTAIIANGLSGNAALLRGGFSEWFHLPGEWEGSSPRALSDSVIAGNRWLTPGEDFELPRWPDGGFRYVDWREVQCLGDHAAVRFDDRPAPFEGLESGGSGPLIDIDPSVAYPNEGGFLVARSFIVDNDNGGVALIRARLASGLSVQVLHNTFANIYDQPVIEVEAAAPDSSLVVFRNLLGDASDSGTAPISLHEEPGGLFVSMNATPGALAWSELAVSSERQLLGPSIILGSVGFLDGAQVRASDPCSQLLTVCPNATAEDCVDRPETAPSVPCPLAAAAHWLPDGETAHALAWPWPWDTGFLPTDPAAANVAGATGWTCYDSYATVDRSGGVGDGDGYPDAFDCDNDDPDVIPLLPDLNGVDTQDCDPAGGNCWICPEGTAIDDDDSGPLPDDDDSGPLLDDDDSVPTDDDDYAPIPPTCQGCGFSWNCSDGVTSAVLLFPLLLLPTRRRRAA